MNFDDLISAYKSSPTELFERTTALSAQERHDLLLENIDRRLHANRVLEEEQVEVLPREFRRQAGVRWDHFGYVAHYFTREMLERQLLGHLAIETSDPKSQYMRNLLAMLTWMSVDHANTEEDREFESDAAGKRGRRRKN